MALKILIFVYGVIAVGASVSLAVVHRAGCYELKYLLFYNCEVIIVLR